MDGHLSPIALGHYACGPPGLRCHRLTCDRLTRGHLSRVSPLLEIHTQRPRQFDYARGLSS